MVFTVQTLFNPQDSNKLGSNKLVGTLFPVSYSYLNKINDWKWVPYMRFCFINLG